MLTNDDLRKIMELQEAKREKYRAEHRNVPLSNNYNPKCIVCSKILKRDECTPDSNREAHKDNWEYGTVDIICPGWASRYDMVEMLIAICDDCIDKAKEDGRISWTFNRIEY